MQYRAFGDIPLYAIYSCWHTIYVVYFLPGYRGYFFPVAVAVAVAGAVAGAGAGAGAVAVAVAVAGAVAGAVVVAVAVAVPSS